MYLILLEVDRLVKQLSLAIKEMELVIQLYEEPPIGNMFVPLILFDVSFQRLPYRDDLPVVIVVAGQEWHRDYQLGIRAPVFQEYKSIPNSLPGGSWVTTKKPPSL